MGYDFGVDRARVNAARHRAGTAQGTLAVGLAPLDGPAVPGPPDVGATGTAASAPPPVTSDYWQYAISGAWGGTYYWSTGAVPTSTSAVFINLAGTYGISVYNQLYNVYSVSMSDAGADLGITSGGTLAIATTLSISAGTLQLDARGELLGGTLSFGGSGILLATGGTLSGVTCQGVLAQASGTLSLAGTDAFTGTGGAGIGTINLTGNSSLLTLTDGSQVGPVVLNERGSFATVNVDDSHTLNGGALNVGSAGAFNEIYISDDTGNGATLTIGSSELVNLSAGDGEFYLANGGDALVNQGTLNVTSQGQPFDIQGAYVNQYFLNQGTINVSNGGTLLIDVATSNAGRMNVSGANSVLGVGGTFTAASLGSLLASINNSGGTLALSGLLNNAGTLTIGAGTAFGTLGLDGGTISGGTISDMGGGLALIGGSFSGVSYQGALTAQGNFFLYGTDSFTGAGGSGAGTISMVANNTLIVVGTLAGNATINLIGTYAGLAFETGAQIGTATINATGSYSVLAVDAPLFSLDNGVVNIGNSAVASAVLLNGNNASMLTLGGHETFNATGLATVICEASTNALVNLGTIDVAGAGSVLNFSGGIGKFSNQGSVIVTNGGMFDLSSLGSFSSLSGNAVVGGSYEVDAGSTLRLLNNTTIAYDEASIILSGVGSTIESKNTGSGQFVTIDQTLIDITGAGTLQLLAGRNFTAGLGSFTDSGILLLGGGTFTASSGLSVTAGGRLIGFGTVAGSVANAGLVMASGGTLALTSALSGTGTLSAATGAVLDLRGGGTLSEAIVGGGTLQLDGGTFTLAGGTLGVAAVVVDAGATLSGYGTITGTVSDAGTVVASGGTLLLSGGVTVAGTVNVANTGTLNVRGGLNAASGGGTINLSGSGAALNLYDTQTLNNATLNFGNAASYNQINLVVDDGGPDTLTLGRNFNLTQTGAFAQIQLDPRLSTAANTFDNQGTLTAGISGGNVEISGGYSTFLNQGSLIVNNGDAVSVTSSFTNTGSITLSAGNLYLYGMVTDGGLGFFRTYNGSAIVMDGTLQNAGQVITVGAAAQLSLGGFVLGGEITDAGGGLAINAGTLSDVDYNGTLNLGATSNLTIDSGLNVGGAAGTFNLSGGTSLYFDNTETVGNATFAVGNNSTYETLVLGTVYGGGNGTQTLTLSSQAAIVQTGTFAEILLDQAGSGNALINQGTISVAAAGGVLDISGPYAGDYFANQGSLIVGNGAQVDLATNVTQLGNFSTAGGGTLALVSGATLSNAGATLALGTGAQLTLNGGSIAGGTVRDSGGGLLIGANGGTLSGVNYSGALSLTGTDATLVVTGGLNTGATYPDGYFTVSGNGAAIDFVGSQSFENAQVDLGSDSGTAFLNLEGVNNQSASLTFGANVEQTGSYAEIDYDPSGLGNSLVIDSQITAGLAGATLSIVGAYAGDTLSVGANGLLFAYDGGTLDLSQAGTLANAAGGTLTGGAVIADQYSTILLDNDADITTLSTVVGLNGYGASIEWYNSVTGSETMLDQSLVAITSTGSLQVVNQNFAAGSAFTDDGTLTLIAVNFSDAGGLSIGAGGWLQAGANYATTTISAYLSDTGTFSIYQGTVDLTGGGALGGDVDINGGGALQLDAAIYDLTGGTVTAFGGAALNVDAGASLSGYGTVAGWSGIPAVIADAGTIEASGGTLSLAATITGDGALTADAGAVLDLVGGGSLAQSISGAGTLQLDSGTFTLPSYGVSVGTVAVEAGATLLNTGGTSLYATLVVGGTITIGADLALLNGIEFTGTGGLIDGSASSAYLELSGGAAGTGSIDVTGQNAYLALSNTQTLQDGTLTVGNGSTAVYVYLQGGTLTLASDYTVALAGVLVDFYLGDSTDELINQGMIDASFNLANLGDGQGTIINQGTIAITNGAQLTVDVALFENEGLISLDSGALAFQGTLTSASLGSIVNTGGVIAIEGLLENSGTLAIGGGTALGTIGLIGEISGGTILDAGNGLNGAGGALADVTYEGALAINGDLTLRGSDEFTGADGTGGGTITIANPGYLTLEGTIAGAITINLGGPPQADYGSSEFTLADGGALGAASFNLDDSATVNIDDSHTLGDGTLTIGGGGAVLDISDDTGSGATLTLGAGYAVDLAAGSVTTIVLQNSNDALVNQGTITVGGDVFQIYGEGGGGNYAGGFDNQGNVLVQDGSSLAVLTAGAANSGIITIAGDGYANFAGALSGTGTVNLLGADSRLFLSGGGALSQVISGPGTLSLDSLAAFTLVQNVTVAAGVVDILENTSLSGAGTITGELDNIGTLTANAGTLLVQGAVSDTMAGYYGVVGAFTIAAGATLDFAGGGRIDTMVTDAGTLEASGGTLVLAGGIAGAGALAADAGAVLDLLGGGVLDGNVTGAGTLELGGATTLSTGAITVANVFIDADGSLSGGGTLSGAVVNDGLLAATTARVKIAGAISGAGTLSAAANLVLDLAGGGALSGTVSGGGRLQLDGTSLFSLTPAALVEVASLVVDRGATLAGAGAIASAVTDHGTMMAQGGTLVLSGAVSGTGRLEAAVGAVLDLTGGGILAPAISGAGTLELGAAFTLGAAAPTIAAVRVDAEGSLSGAGRLASAVVDNGAVQAAGGTLVLAGMIAGAGTLAAAAGATLDVAKGGSFGGALAGAGTIDIAGATTLTVGASLAAANVVQTANLTLGSGVQLTNGAGDLVTMSAAAGKTVVLGGGAGQVFVNDGGLNATGAGTETIGVTVINQGIASVGSGKLVFLDGVTNNGTLNAISGTLSVTGAVSGSGTSNLGAAGTLGFGGSVGSGQIVDFAAAGGVLDLSHASGFAAGIDGFGAGDRIDLLNAAATGASYANGVLTVKNGHATVASLHFGGVYTQADFALGTDGHGGTWITFV